MIFTVVSCTIHLLIPTCRPLLKLYDLYLSYLLRVRRTRLQHFDLLVDVGRIHPFSAADSLGGLLGVLREQGAKGPRKTFCPSVKTFYLE